MYYAQLKIINHQAVVVAVTETQTALPPAPNIILVQCLDHLLLGKSYVDGVFV